MDSAAASLRLDYHCQPCGISMPNANILTHLAGRKHRARSAGLANIDTSGSVSTPTFSKSPPTAPARRRNRHDSIGDAYYASFEDAFRADARIPGQGRAWVPPAHDSLWTGLFKRPAPFVQRETAGSQQESEEVTEVTAATGNGEGSESRITEEVSGTPRPAAPAPVSASTLPPESSTADIAYSPQLSKPTILIAHMKDQSNPRIMAAENAAAEDIPSPQSSRWFCASCKADCPTDQRAEHLGSLLHALGLGEIPSFGALDTPPAPDISEMFSGQTDSGSTAGSQDESSDDDGGASFNEADGDPLRQEVSRRELETPTDLPATAQAAHEQHPSDIQMTQQDEADLATPRSSRTTFFCLPCRGSFASADRKLHLSPPHFCALCNLLMHTDTREIHEWSRAHNRAVAAAAGAGAGTAVDAERFVCATCADSFPVAVRPFHRSRAWMCEVCAEMVHMDWIGAHLAGAGHVAMELEGAEEREQQNYEEDDEEE